MNACEDRSNPLGESPDVPARSGVAAVLAAADKVSAYQQACQEIRSLAGNGVLIRTATVVEILDRLGV